MSEPSMTIPPPPPERRIFCNRTLNLRAIRAIGYDMDYTLVHYKVDEWEQQAYAYLKQKLTELGWPVEGLSYQRGFAVRGLIIDTELGNIVKADRFGYVKRACHGTHVLSLDHQKTAYARTLVDLSDPRWFFLNTFFSLSEACMYAQLVDRLDARRFTDVLGYAELHARTQRALDEAHAEGLLKREIIEQPDAYVELDPEVPLALLDQKEAGKDLLLITNSDWSYTREIMRCCFDRFLPGEMSWRDLFDLVIVSARKPSFFAGRSPLFEVVNDAGLLRPCVGGPAKEGGVYLGGNARMVEQHLGLSGSEILYVGDHLYTDVLLSKDVLRWRTALLVRELEDELRELSRRSADQRALDRLMNEKEGLEFEQSQIRLQLLRQLRAYGPPARQGADALEERLAALRLRLEALDAEIGPLAAANASLLNPTWGLLMRTGGDKSHLARQIERYADIYTSRVSNFLHQTPFAYLRSPRGSLPHDPLL